mgnify:FL=1
MKLSDNTLGAIPGYFSQKLSEIYNHREATQLAYWSIESVLNFTRSDVLLNSEKRLSESEIVSLVKITDRLRNHEPFEYITGEAYFMHLKLKVTPHVLIPRPETEELVDWIISDCKDRKNLFIRDIGTGSGCIALSLADILKTAKIEATDLDQHVLELAALNAKNLGLNVLFQKEDALHLTDSNKLYDVVVSNPPYIVQTEAETMGKNVVDYEPHLALFVKSDPLEFYKSIALYAEKALKPEGALYFELHENYAQDTAEWIKQNTVFTLLELRKDLQGKHRMLKCLRS